MNCYTDKTRLTKDATAVQLAINRSALPLQDNRPQSVIQKKQVEGLANKSPGENPGVIQLARGGRPGGNPIGRGGKGKKNRLALPDQVTRTPSPDQVSARPLNIPVLGGNPLAALMDLSRVKVDSEKPARIKKMLKKTGSHFNQPHMLPANVYLNSLKDQLGEADRPGKVTLRDITPENDEHGYYDNVNKKLSLGVLNPEAAEKYYEGGYGTAEENLAETGVHEYTHVFDLETARAKPYRLQALQNLDNVLPFMAVGQTEQANAARMKRMHEAGGLIDPHIGLTIGQGFLRGGSHVPLLSELMANFAELGSVKDPVGHLMMRPEAHKKDNESDPQYQQRITGDYDLLMQSAILPYATGIVNDNTLPKGIRDFYLHSMLTVPASGAALHAEMTRRRNDFMQSPMGTYVRHQYAANQNPALQPLADQAKREVIRQNLRQKIKEKRDQRRKK